MPKLIIDNRAIEVPAGTKVIAAAEALGIMIPRFCYHPGQGSFGACRMCAVKFLEGPVQGLEMSCMTEAKDGMVVSTTDPEAVDFRRYVIEWLMLNHPLDCPVCDEGGHCLLQDETVSGGHGLRRYLGPKRTYRDQYLGPFVQHEMNRCIHCWRCRNFYQGFAGYRDYGAMQIGNRMYFGRFADGPLESPFAGNLIDVCPTGVLTDKPSRFVGRRWDFERAPSLCLHCTLGCNATASARYRQVWRLEGRFSEMVNGYFICDRGRYGFAYESHPERPRRARVAGKEAEWPEAMAAAATRLKQIVATYGPSRVACLGSPRSSLEAQAALKRFCRALAWPEPHYFTVPSQERKVKAAISRLDARLAVSMRELEAADFILVAGADPVHEAPMLALALRQAWRRGGRVAVLDPRPVFLPFKFEHLPLAPGEINAALGLVAARALDGKNLESLDPAARQWWQTIGGPGVSPVQPKLNTYETTNFSPPKNEQIPPRPPFSKGVKSPPLAKGDLGGFADFTAKPGATKESRLQGNFYEPQIQASLVDLGQKLGQSKKPVIICGTDVVRESTPALAGDLARLLRQAGMEAGLFYLLPGANAFGAALLSGNAEKTPPLLEALETGAVKALLAVENDPCWDYPDRARLEEALGNLELLVVLDYLPSPLVQRADFVFPTPTLFERTPSSFINQEGRRQPTTPVHRGGTPLGQISPEGHPPRTFLSHIPGGEPRAAGEILTELAAALSPLAPLPQDDLWDWLRRENPVFARIDAPEERLLPVEISPESFPPAAVLEPAPPPPGRLELLLVDRTFGTEELAAYSSHIRQAEEPPRLLMSPGDAARFGFNSGARVSLRLPGGELEVELEVAPGLAAGVLALPRHRRLNWRLAPDYQIMLAEQDLVKVAE
jgi:NADH-quinone oxidoreductase chain G